jgi:hypothetical protein
LNFEFHLRPLDLRERIGIRVNVDGGRYRKKFDLILQAGKIRQSDGTQVTSP